MNKTLLTALILIYQYSPIPINAFSGCNTRRKWVADHVTYYVVNANFWASNAPMTKAVNMPIPTGATMSQTGSVDKLIPIICVQQAILEIQTDIQSAKVKAASEEETAILIRNLYKTISTRGLPTDELKFKRIFDEYSQPPTYKQKFQNQNAFLVYYTNGFDGAGRPAIGMAEAEQSDATSKKQMIQYGARNDAWVAWDEFLAEVKYFEIGSSKLDDVGQPLGRAVESFAEYLNVAPSQQVQEARNSACPTFLQQTK